MSLALDSADSLPAVAASDAPASINSDFRTAAQAYLDHGWAILPIHGIRPGGGCTCGNSACKNPGKHPVLPGGCNAPITVDQLDAYAGPGAAEAYNLGIATGPSGLVVIDIDPRHGGDENLRRLEAMLGRLPATVTAETGGGGLHLLFARPPEGRYTSKANVGKTLLAATSTGVDVRADGGYIVAAPSRHHSGGTYQWRPGLGLGEIALAALPEAWQTVLNADAPSRPRAIAAPLVNAPAPAAAVDVAPTADADAPADYAKARAACAFLAHAEAEAATLSEAEWFAQASNILCCADGARIFTDLSRRYPGAQEREIAQKVARSQAFGKPHTCHHIEHEVGFAGCAACPHREQVKAPVQLGRMTRLERTTAALAALEARVGTLMEPDGIAALVAEIPDLSWCDRAQIAALIQRLSAAHHPAPGQVAKAVIAAGQQRRADEHRAQAEQAGQVVFDRNADTSAHFSDVVVERLASAAPPKLFQRMGVLARVLPPLEPDGPQRIDELREKEALKNAITRLAPFVQITGETVTRIDPPDAVMFDLLHRGSYPGVPPLHGIRRSPIVRADGSVCTTPGYDAVSGCIYDPPADLAGLTIDPAPSPAAVQAARELLEDLLIDFPVLPGDCSRTHMIAALVTLAMRTAISGPVPLVVIEAPYRGSGKTLLAQLIALVVLGEMPPAVAVSGCDEELRKAILALHLTSPEYLLFDNVVAPNGWNPQPFQSLLTSGSLTDRVLGQSTVKTVKSRALLVVTGNSMRLGDDLVRRSLFIQIHPHTDQPAQRDPVAFRHPDIVAYVLANRRRLLSALLTLIQGWVAAGSPQPPRPPLASFERWSSMVGGVLAFAGYTDFLANAASMAQRGNTEHQQWSRFFIALFRCFLSEPAKIARLGCREIQARGIEARAWAVSRPFTVSEIPVALANEHISEEVYPQVFRRDIDSSRKLVSALGTQMQAKHRIRYGCLTLVYTEDRRNHAGRYRLEAADVDDPRVLHDLYDQITVLTAAQADNRPIFLPGGGVTRAAAVATVKNAETVPSAPEATEGGPPAPDCA